jgi:predicted double-glycine peptidase
MSWLFLILNLILLWAAAFAGWRSRLLHRRGFFATMLAGAVLLLLRSFLHLRPEYEQHLLSLSSDYIYFASWGGPVSVLMIFALAGRLPKWQWRKAAVITMTLMMPVFLWSSLVACAMPNYSMAARFDSDDVCRQTTDYSCGPAAALTVLKRLGQDLSEGEMARLCLLRPNEGVSLLELCRGLNVALEGRPHRATIERHSIDDLTTGDTPFLAELQRPNAVDHCVAVLSVTDDVLVLGDPAYGKRVVGRDEFRKEWTGLIITVRPTTPTVISRLPLGASLP